jgi:hypothetical protein
MKLKGLSKEELENLLVPNLLFLGYRGSIAHGMYVPNSDPNSIDDKDVMGIFVASRDHYVGLRQEKETVEKWYNEWDCVYYEIRKIISLLLKGNPNVLSTLWLDERYIIQSSEAYSVLRKSRDIFASKKVYHAFCGYAHSQFKKMTAFTFNGYMGEKRKTLVEKYGFDVKNAVHLIRLLKMGIEFLTEGTLYVERTLDASQLLAIKNGQWTLEQVKAEAEKLFKLCEEAYIRSSLPNEPNYDAANTLCNIIVLDHVLPRGEK